MQNVQSTSATLVAKTCLARLVADIIVYVNIKIGKRMFNFGYLTRIKYNGIVPCF